MIIDSDYILEILNKINSSLGIDTEDKFKELYDNKEIPKTDILKCFSGLRLELGEHMKLDTISFLLGNGASIYAGSKSTMDFSISEFASDSRFRKIHNVITHVDGIGMEEQLNALISIKAYYSIMKDDKEKLVDILLEELKKNLIENYVNSIDYSKLIYHEMLFLKLRSFGCLDRVRVYTPNYDLGLEYTLDKLGIDYSDGFTGFVNRRFDPKTLQYHKTVLAKIHGSVNWVFEDDEVKEIQPRFDGYRLIVEDVKPVLIYPTSGKTYQTYSTPYSELMRDMLNTFQSTKNIILVLGYKYGDNHINDILLKSMANPKNIFYFFDYANDNCVFIEKVKKIAEQMPNINILSGKILGDFIIFVEYMLPAKAEKTDEEQAIDSLRKVINNDAK